MHEKTSEINSFLKNVLLVVQIQLNSRINILTANLCIEFKKLFKF